MSSRHEVPYHEDVSIGRAYVASESGIVSVFGSDGSKVGKVFEGFLGPDAHVVAIDPKQHLAYFPLKSLRPGPVLRIVRVNP